MSAFSSIWFAKSYPTVIVCLYFHKGWDYLLFLILYLSSLRHKQHVFPRCLVNPCFLQWYNPLLALSKQILQSPSKWVLVVWQISQYCSVTFGICFILEHLKHISFRNLVWPWIGHSAMWYCLLLWQEMHLPPLNLVKPWMAQVSTCLTETHFIHLSFLNFVWPCTEQ